MGGCSSKKPDVPWSHTKIPDEFVEVSEEHGGHHTAMMVAMAEKHAAENGLNHSPQVSGKARVMTVERILSNQANAAAAASATGAAAKKHGLGATILGQIPPPVERTAYFHPSFHGDPFRILDFLTDLDLGRLTQTNVQLHRVVEAFVSIRNAKLEANKPADYNWHKLGSGTQARKFDRFVRMVDTLPPSAVEEVFADEIDVARFKSAYEAPNIPVVIRDLAVQWAAFNSPSTLWTFSNLLRRFSDVYFRFNDLHGEEIQLRDYVVAYARSTDDDSPLGLYDSQIGVEEGDARAALLDEYANPVHIFGEDLFDLVKGSENRPPFRWMLLGPERSGTGMHIDPLGTSAWVTVLSGRKLWILFPPGTNGVGLEDDLTSWEWFGLNFPQCLKDVRGAVYVLQNSGETVFVPGGWLHAVVNLEETVAITHNYAPRENLDYIMSEVLAKEPEFAKEWKLALQANGII